MRRILALALIGVLSAAAGGCSRGGASEMLDTARLEEVQRNVPHARKLYQEIIEKYPGTPEAAQAKERLAALDQQPPAQ
jgi:hypothetical protein